MTLGATLSKSLSSFSSARHDYCFVCLVINNFRVCDLWGVVSAAARETTLERL
jgi:hypothetical protein